MQGPSLAIGHGLRGTIRGLGALREFTDIRRRPPLVASPPPDVIPRPQAVADVDGGAVLTFSAMMELLRGVGLSIAPYAVLRDDHRSRHDAVPFPGPYVVKIADCPHRTEIGGVRIGVKAEELHLAVEEIRRVARDNGYPVDVVVQPQLRGRGEFFIGAQVDGELGSLVLGGLGGVHVESMRAFAARLTPLGHAEALGLISEADWLGVFEGRRGQRSWNAEGAASALVRVGALIEGARQWLTSLDINPLILVEDEFVVVDALGLVRSHDVSPSDSRPTGRVESWH
jgi:acetyltransferase